MRIKNVHYYYYYYYCHDKITSSVRHDKITEFPYIPKAQKF